MNRGIFMLALCLLAACAPRQGYQRPTPPARAPAPGAAVRSLPAPAAPLPGLAGGPHAAPPGEVPVAASAPLPMVPRAPASPQAAPASVPDFAAQALAELQRTDDFTDLSDEQLARQKRDADWLKQGQAQAAYQDLAALNRELAAQRDPYRVQPGESLWTIASKPEVYNNGWLWPLIWDANRDRLKKPERVFAGMTLQIRRHPTVDEVAHILAPAPDADSTVHIGELKEKTGTETPP